LLEIYINTKPHILVDVQYIISISTCNLGC